jgi:hypothetical protein
MKRFNLSAGELVFTFLTAGFLFLTTGICFAQKSTGAMHCLGNGQYCVYQQGMDIKSLFGPTYSSPSYLQLNLKDKNISVKSTRLYGTAIWKHSLTLNGEKIAEITDFVDGDLPVFVRQIVAGKPFALELNILNDPLVTVIDNSADYSGKGASALMIHKDRGLPIYGVYSHPYEQFHQIIIRENGSVSKSSEAGHYEIKVGKGQNELYFIGGPFYQECDVHTDQVLALGYDELYNRTLKSWKSFTGRRVDFGSRLTKKNPDRQAILEQIDHVAVLLKTQQAVEGAVLAGHAYHLGYVRDQYGVSRGYLALGYFEEAKKILDFYWQIWQKFGILHNAQAIGVPGIFHIHENDEVEMTGYLIIQAFDYLKRTNDTRFVKTILPMLEWAWNVQKKNLAGNMLPFNGDETYVAGGILPRTTLNDGSTEATLLFVQSGRLLLPFIKSLNFWSKDILRTDENLLMNVAANYARNFIREGKIMANNPSRVSIAAMPDFRHGVCAGGHGVVYTKKDKNGNYLCPKCYLEKKEFPPYERKSFYIPSIALTPKYIGSDLIPGNLLKENIDIIKENYVKSAQISSRPGLNTVIGYEYGFLLYALSMDHDPLAERVFKDAMSVVDEAGAWVEYYQNGKPMGCRYRPWESAINIEAIIAYALSRENGIQ